MQSYDRELSADSRQYIYLANSQFPAVVIAGAWALYAGSVLLDIDMIQLIKPRDREFLRRTNVDTMYLEMAIFFTIISLIFAWLGIRRALQLARCGIPVACEVVNVGMISYQGMVRVDYEYSVDGTTYCRSLTCPWFTARDYESGKQPLEIVYDPRRPKRVMLKSDVFPKSNAATDKPHDS